MVDAGQFSHANVTRVQVSGDYGDDRSNVRGRTYVRKAMLQGNAAEGDELRYGRML